MEKIDGIITDLENKKFFLGTLIIENGKIASIQPMVNSGYYYQNSDKMLPFIFPGFIDSHLHIELTQLSPAEYARAALSQGIIGAVIDCHETATATGRKGVEKLIENSRQVPFYFGFSAPGVLSKNYGLSDLEELLKRDDVTHVGEIRDFPSVLLHEPSVEAIFDLAKKYDKPVDGYAPGVTGKNLDEYCKSIISTEHEFCSTDNAIEKMEHGLYFQLQTRDAVDYLGRTELFDEYSDKLMLCSDHIYASNIGRGYINKSVAKAVRENHNIFNILKAACINPVKHYRLKCGTLHEGDSADFIVVDNNYNFNVLQTYIAGKKVYDNPKLKHDIYNLMSLESVPKAEKKLDIQEDFSTEPLKLQQIEIPVAKGASTTVNVLDVSIDEIHSGCRTAVLSTEEKNGNQLLKCNLDEDILKVVVCSKTDSSKVFSGFVHGFGIEKGALAMSICHDNQELIAVGTNDEDILLALNQILASKGGISIVADGKVEKLIVLNQEGLMSDKTCEEVSLEMNEMSFPMRQVICAKIKHPIRALSHLVDITIPNYKVSSKGYFNVACQEYMPLTVD